VPKNLSVAPISGEVLPRLPKHDPYIFWKISTSSSRICMGRVLGVAAELHQKSGDGWVVSGIHSRIYGGVLPRLPKHDPYIFCEISTPSYRICMGRVLGVAAELHQKSGDEPLGQPS